MNYGLNRNLKSGTEIRSKKEAEKAWERLTDGVIKRKKDNEQKKGKLIRVSPGVLKRKAIRFSGIAPKKITDGIFMILSDWKGSARSLCEKGLIPREEIFFQGKYIFRVNWLILALKNDFPDLVNHFYKGNEKKLKSTVSAKMSLAKEAFKIRGFMEDFKDLPGKGSRQYLLSDEFSFERLKNIFNLREKISKRAKRKINFSQEGKGTMNLTIDGKEKTYRFKKSIEIVVD